MLKILINHPELLILIFISFYIAGSTITYFELYLGSFILGITIFPFIFYIINLLIVKITKFTNYQILIISRHKHTYKNLVDLLSNDANIMQH
jgi:hypothetical protein